MPKITFAWPWTGVTEQGSVERTHKAGSTANVDADTARDLIRRGLARKADEAANTAASTSDQGDQAPQGQDDADGADQTPKNQSGATQATGKSGAKPGKES